MQLALSPMVGALAAGYRIVLKPSEQVPETPAALCRAVAQYLDSDLVCAFEGNVEGATAMSALPFDNLLFTGSTDGRSSNALGTDGGPTASTFDLRNTAIETAFLLTSSFTCGMASLALEARKAWIFQGMMAATFALGAAFLIASCSHFGRNLSDLMLEIEHICHCSYEQLIHGLDCHEAS